MRAPRRAKYWNSLAILFARVRKTQNGEEPVGANPDRLLARQPRRQDAVRLLDGCDPRYPAKRGRKLAPTRLAEPSVGKARVGLKILRVNRAELASQRSALRC